MSAAIARLLLVDDHPLVRDGLRAHFDATEGMKVVGEAGRCDDGVRQCRRLAPDLVITDINLPDGSGLDLAARLRCLEAAPAVLMLTMYEDPEYVSRARRAGAGGYILKEAPVHQLIAAVRAVLAGEEYFPPPMAKPRGRDIAVTQLINEREREVLILVAQGESNKVIARRLKVSLRTVEMDRMALRRKLGVDSTAALVRFALEQGWTA